MRHVALGMGGATALAAAGAAFGYHGWLAATGLAAGGFALWQLTRCRHSGPLGLLPPTAATDGHVEPARWFCDRCGHTWPAGFDHESGRPVPRFTGYDESKAASAAKRARDLDQAQRRLALQRAGLRRSRRPATPGAQIVPIGRPFQTTGDLAESNDPIGATNAARRRSRASAR